MQPLDREHIAEEARIGDEPATKTVEVQTIYRYIYIYIYIYIYMGLLLESQRHRQIHTQWII